MRVLLALEKLSPPLFSLSSGDLLISSVPYLEPHFLPSSEFFPSGRRVPDDMEIGGLRQSRAGQHSRCDEREMTENQEID